MEPTLAPTVPPGPVKVDVKVGVELRGISLASWEQNKVDCDRAFWGAMKNMLGAGDYADTSVGSLIVSDPDAASRRIMKRLRRALQVPTPAVPRVAVSCMVSGTVVGADDTTIESALMTSFIDNSFTETLQLSPWFADAVVTGLAASGPPAPAPPASETSSLDAKSSDAGPVIGGIVAGLTFLAMVYFYQKRFGKGFDDKDNADFDVDAVGNSTSGRNTVSAMHSSPAPAAPSPPFDKSVTATTTGDGSIATAGSRGEQSSLFARVAETLGLRAAPAPALAVRAVDALPGETTLNPMSASKHAAAATAAARQEERERTKKESDRRKRGSGDEHTAIKSLRRSLVPGQVPGQEVRQQVPDPVSISAVPAQQSKKQTQAAAASTADRPSDAPSASAVAAKRALATGGAVDFIPAAADGDSQESGKGSALAVKTPAGRVRRSLMHLGAADPSLHKPARKGSLAIASVGMGAGAGAAGAGAGAARGGWGSSRGVPVRAKPGENLPEPLEFL